MWATFPMLREALDVIEAWGFSYKTVAFNWVKQNRNGTGIFMGLGNWTRSNSEICLLATKGKPKRISGSVRSIVLSPLQQHSRKPAEIRNRIVELMGDLPRIELFAREAAPGWDVWGNVATLSAASSMLLSAFGRDPVGELTGTIFTACVGYLITYAGKSLGEKISRNRHGLDADGNPLPDPSGDTLNNEEAKG